MEYFPRYNTLQLSDEVKSLLLRLGETPETFTRKNHIYVDVQRHFLWNKRQCIRMSGKRHSRISVREKIWKKDNGHLVVLVLRKSGTVSVKTVHKEYGTKLQNGCCWNLLRADVQFSVLRLLCPEGQLRSKGHGKLSIHCAADLETVETLFRISVSANQLSLYGAVAEILEEYESLHERTERLVVMGQSSSSLVLSVIKTDRKAGSKGTLKIGPVLEVATSYLHG